MATTGNSLQISRKPRGVTDSSLMHSHRRFRARWTTGLSDFGPERTDRHSSKVSKSRSPQGVLFQSITIPDTNMPTNQQVSKPCLPPPPIPIPRALPTRPLMRAAKHTKTRSGCPQSLYFAPFEHPVQSIYTRIPLTIQQKTSIDLILPC